MPERRVPEVVGQAGGVDDVGIAAERLPELAADLGDLEGVGQPGADEVVRAGADDLGLRGEPAQRRGVQDPGAVAGERGAAGALGRLGDPAFDVGGAVPGASSTSAGPAFRSASSSPTLAPGPGQLTATQPGPAPRSHTPKVGSPGGRTVWPCKLADLGRYACYSDRRAATRSS